MRYIVGGVIIALVLSVAAVAEPPAATPSVSDPVVVAKLDQILSNQQELFRRLEAIDEELKIIKIRSSRRH